MSVREELEKELAKRDYEYYVENFVKIEDRDSDILAVPFLLWEGQKKALKDFVNERLNIVLKARQLGFTWLSLAYGSHELLFNKGYQIVALSKKDDDAKELVRRLTFILRYMPRWLIREDTKENKEWYGMKWTSTTSSVTIIHTDGENSIFNSFSAAPDSGRSFTANLVIIDEWAFQQWAREIWAAAYPTINRPTGGKVIGISTAKRMTLFEEIWKKSKAKINTFNTIFLNWRTDPRRDDKWYEQTKRDLGDLKTKQEYPNTPEEAFEAAEGSAFPEFSYDIHVIKPFEIPKHWKKWKSVDNGYTDPFAWYWYAVSEQGQVYVYREYTRNVEDTKVIYTEQAKKVVELTKEINFNYTVAGHDAWAGHVRDTSNKTLIDYYNEGGIWDFIKANTDRALRKSTIHQYLKPYYDEITEKWTAKVQIFDTCTKLVETLPLLLCDEKDNEKVAECLIDHWFDSFGYGLISAHMKASDVQQKHIKDDFGLYKETKHDMLEAEISNDFLNYGG